MRYFKIQGVIEIEDEELSKLQNEDLEEKIILDFGDLFLSKHKAAFGGGIIEVDENGNHL